MPTKEKKLRTDSMKGGSVRRGEGRKAKRGREGGNPVSEGRCHWEGEFSRLSKCCIS